MGRGKPIKSKPILIDEKKGKYLIVRFFFLCQFFSPLIASRGGGMRVCGGVRECVHGCVQVWEGVHGYARVCTGVRGYAWVWDVFSEFLLENRVPTSADFNTFPIRIFFYR